MFCLVFVMFGIPYFAYMMSAISDVINYQLITLRSRLEERLKTVLPGWFIPLVYIGGGAIILIVLPTLIFVKVEHWSILESIYFCE